MAITRILAPVDFSPASLCGAREAASLAQQLGARLRFVTVLDVGDLRVAMKAHLRGFNTNEEVRRQVQRWIAEEYAKIDLPEGVRATRDIRRGIVEHELVAAVARYRPQLVVMGSAGMRSRFPLGSKTEYLIRNCTVPVVVVTS